MYGALNPDSNFACRARVARETNVRKELALFAQEVGIAIRRPSSVLLRKALQEGICSSFSRLLLRYYMCEHTQICLACRSFSALCPSRSE
jgi:hypothetical protein